MGYIKHNAIVVTAYNAERAVTALGKACEIFPPKMVSPLMISLVNEYYTFFIAPDGSKEGWDTSDEGDEQRRQFIDWIISQSFEDGSNPYAWAKIQYGDEDGEQKLTQASNMKDDTGSRV